MPLVNTDQKVSLLVPELFPAIYRDDAPLLVDFIKNYYEWTEDVDNVEYASKFLRSIRDVELTPTKYLPYHFSELAPSISTNISTQASIFLKNVLGFYRSRGNVRSYEFLFRSVYGELVEIFYPWDNVLIASGSKWVKESVIMVQGLTGDPFKLTGLITGSTSSATGEVESVNLELYGGITYYRLFLSNVVGSFVNGEIVVNDDSTIECITQSPISSVDISSNSVSSYGGGGGVTHQVGDVVDLASSLGGIGGRGTVTSVTANSAIFLTVRNGGKGYTVGNTIITITGGSGTRAKAKVATLSGTELLTFGTAVIRGANSIPINSVNYGNTSAYANTPFTSGISASSLLSAGFRLTTITVGTIATIRMTDYGKGYTSLAPNTTITAVDSWIKTRYALGNHPSQANYGNSALLDSARRIGTITAISVSNTGYGYQQNEFIAISNLTRAAVNGAGSIVPNSLSEISQPGSWVTTSGHLSSDKVIQDSDYYQKFSYEIRSALASDKYNKLVKALVHPVGTKQFSKTTLIQDLDISANSQFVLVQE